jgi:hypothetical protein
MTNLVAVGLFVLLLVSAALVSDWFLVGAATQVLFSAFDVGAQERKSASRRHSR